MTTPLLELERLSCRLGGREVLRDVSLAFEARAFTGLLGPNGAGKSTLLRAALGLVPHDGAVALGGAPRERLDRAERARRVAYAPQERAVAWPVSVEALVSLGRAPHRALAAPLSPADRAAIDAALERMDVASFRFRPATGLSGGEAARVLIARALAQAAPLLLADEPTAGLDPAHQIALMQVFRDLAREGGGVVAALHDLGLAARFCDRIVLLDDGRVVADGPPGAVLTAERLERTYGIQAVIERRDDMLLVVPTARSSGLGAA